MYELICTCKVLLNRTNRCCIHIIWRICQLEKWNVTDLSTFKSSMCTAVANHGCYKLSPSSCWHPDIAVPLWKSKVLGDRRNIYIHGKVRIFIWTNAIHQILSRSYLNHKWNCVVRMFGFNGTVAHFGDLYCSYFTL